MSGRILHAAAIAALACLTGCSFLAPQTQQLSVTTIPAGAQITLNGAPIGTSPLVATVPRGNSSLLVATKKGHLPASAVTTTRISPVGVADIIGAAFIIVPIVGVMADGFYEQKPNNVLMTLPPRSPAN